MKIGGRPEPVVVAMTWDDLWIVAKYQPNLEIAGSPRKVYRDRGRIFILCGRALDGLSRVTEIIQPNSEFKVLYG